ncbi:MAG: hypothetical protein A2Y63_06330 [Candidatus Riflebacteria bacterium RBG_13_59_9]|nr:MAG: hypothetical protein A2Y63_06330 [Candidatus Riflebacteria bacterium RBG_13_59_9]
MRIPLLIASLAMTLALALPANATFMVGEEHFDAGTMRVMQHQAFFFEYVTTMTEGGESSIIKGLFAQNVDRTRVDTDMRGMLGDGEGEEAMFSQIIAYTGMIMKPESDPITLYHVPEKYMILHPDEVKGDIPDSTPEAGAEPEERQEPVVTQEKIGEEKIDNHPCIIYKLTVTYPDEGTLTGRIWVAQDYGNVLPHLKIIAITENGDETMIEFHNVKVGKPDDSWFNIPPGYVEIKDIMELFG